VRTQVSYEGTEVKEGQAGIEPAYSHQIFATLGLCLPQNTVFQKRGMIRVTGLASCCTFQVTYETATVHLQLSELDLFGKGEKKTVLHPSTSPVLCSHHLVHE